jgi:hypothetical protein
MARQPDERPPSMEAFEYDLTKCLSGRSAAVANILGIAHDADLGSVDEPFFDGPRDELTSPGHAIPSKPKRSSREMGLASKDAGLPLPKPADAPADFETEAVPNVAGGGLRALGWFFFVLILVGGATAVFYVAKGEGTAPRPGPEEAASVVEPATNAATTNAATPPEPDRSEPVVVPENPSPPVEPAVDPAKDAGSGEAKAVDDGKDATTAVKDDTQVKPAAGGKQRPPRNNREAARLLAQAKGLVANTHFDEARDIYKRIIKGSHRKQQGYLGLANVAFQQKNADLAITYAKKAGNSIPAKMALGNAYFKKGDYRKALAIYEQVLKRKPKHKEALRSAQEARKRLE